MTIGEIERASAEDEEQAEVRKCWKTGNWSKASSSDKLPLDVIAAFGMRVMRGMRIVVSLSLREKMLKLAHEEHQGIVKT